MKSSATSVSVKRSGWSDIGLDKGKAPIRDGDGARLSVAAACLAATELRTRANVFSLIDPAIFVRAFANDAAIAAGAEPSRDRLRRLRPDPDLIRRRAAGEPLRTLAPDYQVAHTALARYLKRPDVARQLRIARRLTRTNHTRPQARAQPPAH
jgi:hypothetical protein